MRCARSLALLAVLATSTAAVAQEAPGAPAEEAPVETIAATAPPPATRSLPSIGIMADAGIPDGMQGSLVWRPWKALRMSFGGGYNMISKGVRVGATLLPFGRGPSGTLEIGHYFEGNANTTAAKVFGPGIVSSAFGPSLERVGYDFVNAHLGLDFGYKRATFFIHGGLSYLQGHLYNVDAIFNNTPSINGQNSSGLQVTVPQGADVKVIGPSGKIGLIVYFG
ncbi:MAG TPA: hypothetical protein VHL80_16460 [Polyangia bacterium]|nr:hypothetical protein [Polyangia bacterium]